MVIVVNTYMYNLLGNLNYNSVKFILISTVCVIYDDGLNDIYGTKTNKQSVQSLIY